MLAQSVARYWYTLQVLPKSEERSISMPAGMGLWGDTGRGGGVGLSDLWETQLQTGSPTEEGEMD